MRVGENWRVGGIGHVPETGRRLPRIEAPPGAAPRPLTGLADAATELPRRAWFDLDGDGRLEPWKPLYGGDGTIVWPMPGDDPGTSTRRHRAVPDNPLAVDVARAAYERYG